MKDRRSTRRSPKISHNPAVTDVHSYIPNRANWGKRVYAICFDLDTETLKTHYHNASWQNGYQDIARILARHGFDRQQGSVYFGDEKVDPVKCVLAIQDVARECPWFRASVVDVRMLRIEENNDLLPAIGVPEAQLGSLSANAAP